jgi:2-hydroxychromene-2-carboxylate isomerase
VGIEFNRYARRYGVPFLSNTHFPIITLHLMRVVTGTQMKYPERFEKVLAAVFKAMWVDNLNLNEPELAIRTLSEAGLSPEEVDALVNDAEVKAALRATTEEAVSRGVFGAPSTFVDGEMYFGQDKLDFVKEQLAS